MRSIAFIKHLIKEKHNNEYRWVNGLDIQKETGLLPKEINTIVELAENLDLVEVDTSQETTPLQL